ncbi:MlaD family protein [Hyphomonas sp.]|uniref:MlaD family protein n=1 Tax=Hyphomonas sp. TaxID=87 RepID=UPI00391DDC9E
METRANYALIGALVVLATVFAASFVLWFGQSEYRRDYKSYDIVFDGPVSLEQGSAVRYIGIKVGEVADVRVDRADAAKVRARVRVSRDTPIRTDSTASIQLAGITGATFVQISAGTGQLLEARPGEAVPVIRSERTLVDQIVAGGAQALGRANLTFDRINLILTDENIASVSRTLRNIETVSQRLAADDGPITAAMVMLADASEAAKAVEAASIEIELFGKSAAENIEAATAEVRTLTEDVRRLSQSAEQTLAAATRAADATADLMEGPATAALETAGTTTHDLRILINRLDRMAREIERNPQGFVTGDPLPYEERRR